MRNLYFQINDYTDLVEVYTDEKYLQPMDGLRAGEYSAIALQFDGNEFVYFFHEIAPPCLQIIIDELAEQPIHELFNVPALDLKNVTLREVLIELLKVKR